MIASLPLLLPPPLTPTLILTLAPTLYPHPYPYPDPNPNSNHPNPNPNPKQMIDHNCKFLDASEERVLKARAGGAARLKRD